MKVLARFLFVLVAVAFFAGCRNVVHVPQVPPAAQAKLLDYYEQPENKVFVLAVDPSGDFSFGYDYGKPTLKAAAKIAVEKCDANREKHGVVAKPYIYAINDKVVYEEMIRAAHKSTKSEKQAQIDEAAKQDTPAEAGQPAE